MDKKPCPVMRCLFASPRTLVNTVATCELRMGPSYEAMKELYEAAWRAARGGCLECPRVKEEGVNPDEGCEDVRCVMANLRFALKAVEESFR